ncbi:MAG: hypothetical protein NVS4B3_02970 [Gemmatimonadaceae bacterium]
MTFSLKPITPAGVAAALEKAKHYRLLNDAAAAESICLDVIEIDPENQEALVTLLLAITDQFVERLAGGVARARDVLPRLGERTSARTTLGSSASAAQRRILGTARMVQRQSPTSGSGRPWTCTKRRNGCDRRGTTTRSCAGTPASEFWRGIIS